LNQATYKPSVKLHVFEPSNRKIWTVVGEQDEHWLSPDLDFCSCPGFYFNNLMSNKKCSHLEAVRLAKKNDSVVKIIFSDEEYDDFLTGVICDLYDGVGAR
jgi:predicted nucleic acid-binding Zn finger protein